MPYYDYKGYLIEDYSSSDDFAYGVRIGSGHYADVYKGVNL